MAAIFNDFINLFYPKTCANCATLLLDSEPVICTFCRHDLPLTNFNSFTDNKINKTFYGRVPITYAYALLYFRKKSSTKQLIHQLKYKNNQAIGTFFGNWLGGFFSENKVLNSIDYIIPVPIHNVRKKERGYNQVTTFGKAISKHLNTPFLEHILVRTDISKTQTLKTRFDRFNNVNTKFLLNDHKKLNNKHILLLDDVITTGATIEACCLELLKAKNITISVLTIAYTE